MRLQLAMCRLLQCFEWYSVVKMRLGVQKEVLNELLGGWRRVCSKNRTLIFAKFKEIAKGGKFRD
ncbi:MAG: hypothetical protein K0Q77_3097 [Anaerosporomusa subterranea]|jgi:hypothetical protein|nr:hypothetical protein [Anaerosporomusa subterranea]